MNRNEFNRFVRGTALPGPGDIEDIRELTRFFPWFHSAHMVLLRGLKENSDTRFEAQLKSSALSVSDRALLFQYLYMPSVSGGGAEISPAGEAGGDGDTTSGASQEESDSSHTGIVITSEPEIAEVTAGESAPETGIHHDADVNVNVEREELTVDKITAEESSESYSGREDDTYKGVVDEQESISTEDLSGRSREALIAEIEARLREIELRAGAVPGNTTASEATTERREPDSSSQPVEDDLLELLPETDYETPEPERKLTPADLIDRFIESEPRIERMTPGKESPMVDLSESREQHESNFITETLAKIYINQGYYSKAINIYEKLALQYPEKSAYFASRIEKVKELIK